MESTPRPILGSPREPQRLPFPLGSLARGLRRLSRTESRQIHVRLGPDGAVVEVHGALGAHEARDLKRIVGATLAEGVPGMTIDLGAAGRIAPAGLAALVDLSQRANGTLRLARLKPEVRLLLEQAGLHVIVEIVE